MGERECPASTALSSSIPAEIIDYTIVSYIQDRPLSLRNSFLGTSLCLGASQSYQVPTISYYATILMLPSL